MRWPGRRIMAVLIGGAATAIVIGCTGSGDESSGSVVDEMTVRQARGTGPIFATDKRSVKLSGIHQDQQTTVTFLVFNRGDAPLKLGAPKLNVLSGCDVVESVGAGIVVPPGEGSQLPVRFGAHTRTGPHKISLAVPSNDQSSPVATLLVEFDVAEAEPTTASGPRLGVDKDFIDIGHIPTDWPLYEQFTLRNDGDEPLVIRDDVRVRVLEGC